MKRREIIITVIVLLGIGWLFYENYTRSQQPKPATVEHVKPVTK